MPNKEEEILAVKIVRDYLKEEKNKHIKAIRSLTGTDGEPPDVYFEMGDLKIACEVERFDLVGQPAWEKGKNLSSESNIICHIVQRVQRSLHEKGIPPLGWSMAFIAPPTEAQKHAENIVKLITMMYDESITDGQTYKQNNPSKYYRLFIRNNVSDIMFYYRDVPDGANIDEKYPYLYHVSIRPGKPIKVEEMQAVITKKDKKIPNYNKCYDYDQKWLIITNHANVGYFVLERIAKETEYECDFDKVWYTQSGWIGPTTRKQEQTESLTDMFTVYELKTKPHKKKQGEN